MIARSWFLLTLVVIATAAPAAGSTPDERAARYYAEGLEAPLLQIRAAAELQRACAGPLKKACSQEQRKAATGASALVLLDELTLFPQRSTADAAAGIANRRELERKMGETGAALMREAGAYDRELFARVQATQEACGMDESADYLTSLQALKLVNYAGFQAVPADRLAKMLIDETDREEMLAEQMSQWPREDCIAARKLGEHLMQLMNYKLGPWRKGDAGATPGIGTFRFDPANRSAKKEPPKPDDRELAQAVAGNFVTVVATELQLMVFPESEKRIKPIAESQGFPY
jgi:hypothetical protein